MKESSYKRAHINFIAVLSTFKFSYIPLLYTGLVFFFVEILQLIIFLLPIKILIIFIANDVSDFASDIVIRGDITISLTNLLYIYFIIVAASLITRYFYYYLIRNGGEKIATISLAKDMRIPGAAWYHEGKKLEPHLDVTKRQPGWELNSKKLSLVNKRFGIANTFIGNFLLISLILILVLFLSKPVFVALASLLIINYVILWNLQYFNDFIHPEGVWPTLSFIKLYLKFSETIIFVLVFSVAILSILDSETFQIYMTIIGIFFSRRAINSGTQLINCLLATPISLSVYEKEKIEARYNV